MAPLLTILRWGAGIALALVAALSGLLLFFTNRQAHSLTRATHKPLEKRPEDVGLAGVEELRIPGPRGMLSAWYLPATNGCTLICCHGVYDNKGQWIEQVARLHARSGYGALLFDFGAHGESEGEVVTFGVRERGDVAAVVEYLRERGDVNMAALGILGYSLGAITSVLAAATLPELQVVVIESGFSDLQRDIGELFTRFTHLPAFPFANLVVFWGERIAQVRLGEIRPEQVIGQISPRPILIISDLNDTLAIEPEDGERLYAAAGEPKEFWQVVDVGHVQAFALLPDEWIVRVGGFLDRYLAPLGQRQGEQQAAGD